jgi:hypothetical protein
MLRNKLTEYTYLQKAFHFVICEEVRVLSRYKQTVDGIKVEWVDQITALLMAH